MKRIPSILSVALILLFLSSRATRVPFTQQVREEFSLTAKELQSLQFYASQDIVLNYGKKNNNGKETKRNPASRANMPIHYIGQK